MAHSKYSDEKIAAEADRVLDTPEYKLHLLPPRKYDPGAGGDDGEGGIYSHLTELCSGDWSWKPHRYAQDSGHVLTEEEILALYPDRLYVPNVQVPRG